MSHPNQLLWSDLQKVWKKAYPFKSGTNIQLEAGAFFKENKKEPEKIRAKMQQLQLKFRVESAQGFLSLCKGFAKHKQINQSGSSRARDHDEGDEPVHSEEVEPVPSDEVEPVPSDEVEPVPSDEVEPDPADEGEPRHAGIGEREPDSSSVSNTRSKIQNRNKARVLRAQVLVQEELDEINASIANLMEVTGAFSDLDRKQLKKLQDTKRKIQTRLKRLISNRMATIRYRQKNRIVISEDNVTRDIRACPGRPRIEEGQPALLETISEIAMMTASAHERRRRETVRTCRTLDSLREELLQRGFVLSKTALYYKLLPRNSATIDGKRHVSTVPVKLAKCSNDLRHEHQDAHFAAATIMYIKDLAAILGETIVGVVSQDDKARVSLGLAAAKLQAPLLMHMEYRVTLPDHDWVVASRHKLIPSVYAGLKLNKNGDVGYSGPTYIAVRSGKHDSSTAKSHSEDFQRLLQLECFDTVLKISNGDVKPVIFLLVDGGPDENPRYPKTLTYAASTFKRYNLDAIIVATHAPRQSAFNPVERRMAPLSKQLAGVILDPESCGSHLDSRGRTTDLDLEKQNFKRAGTVLSEIWNELVIDNYPVFSEYLEPGAGIHGTDSNGADSCIPPDLRLTEDWKSCHVRQSRYCLQIVKCADGNCCGERRTNFASVVPNGFLPPPVLFRRTSQGILAVAPEETVRPTDFFGSLALRIALNPMVLESLLHLYEGVIPFDVFCPSELNKIKTKICKQPNCGLYFPSVKALTSHKIVHRTAGKSLIVVNSNLNDLFEDEEPECYVENEDCHIIQNLRNWSAATFTQM